eukprot:8893262-Alexandrium_andersonii.AAC.1
MPLAFSVTTAGQRAAILRDGGNPSADRSHAPLGRHRNAHEHQRGADLASQHGRRCSTQIAEGWAARQLLQDTCREELVA